MMKLYYADVLSPRKVCAVARHLGTPLEYVYLDLARGEHRKSAYRAINPNAKVPTLVTDSGTLWEADAIMCYLAARCDSDLWPQDSRQFEVLRWLSWNLQHFHPHTGTLYLQHVIKPRFALGPANPDEVDKALAGFRAHAPVLESQLATRRWLVDDTLTVADFSLAATLPWADQAGIPLDEFPAIHAWHQRMLTLEAWRNPFPQRAATAQPTTRKENDHDDPHHDHHPQPVV